MRKITTFSDKQCNKINTKIFLKELLNTIISMLFCQCENIQYGYGVDGQGENEINEL